MGVTPQSGLFPSSLFSSVFLFNFTSLHLCLSSSLLFASVWRVLCCVVLCCVVVLLWLFLKTVDETHVFVLLFLLRFCPFL